MCLSPYKMRNPNYQSSNPKIVALKDVTSQMIEVPCGTCAECRMIRQSDYLQRCEVASLDHDFYYGTLTYKDSAIPRTKVFNHIDGSVRSYKYADVRDFRLMMKRVRKTYLHNSVDVKYLAVTEYGGKKHRMHFHFLLAVPREKFLWTDWNGHEHTYNPDWKYNTDNFANCFWQIFLFEWRRNTSKSTKKPVWQTLCDYVVDSRGRSTYDFHYVEPLTRDGKFIDSVCLYVTKYVLKFDKWYDSFRHALYNNLSPEDYRECIKCVRPRVLCSLYLGVGNRRKDDNGKYYLVRNSLYDNYVQKGIDDSINGLTQKDYAVFYDTSSGRTSPLSRYMRHHYLKFDDAVSLRNNELFHKKGDIFADIVTESRQMDELLKGNRDYIEKAIYKYERIYAYLEECNNEDFITTLYGEINSDP